MTRLLLCGIALLGLTGCFGGQAGADNTSPDGAVKATVAALKANDIERFAATAIPPAAYAEAEAEWRRQQSKPVDDQEAAQFDMMMTQLTADGAEQTLLAMVKPQLAEAQGMVQRGAGMLTMVASQTLASEELSPEEQQQMQAFTGAVGQWLGSIDLTDEAKVGEAIDVACATARELEIPNHAALRALSFDQALRKGGILLAGVKEILAIYDLDVDATLDSVEVGSPEIDGDIAKVPVTVTLLGQTYTSPSVLQQVDGRWYGQQPEEPAMLEQAPMEPAGSGME